MLTKLGVRPTGACMNMPRRGWIYGPKVEVQQPAKGGSAGARSFRWASGPRRPHGWTSQGHTSESLRLARTSDVRSPRSRTDLHTTRRRGIVDRRRGERNRLALRGLRHPRQQIDAAGGDERVGTDFAGTFRRARQDPPPVRRGLWRAKRLARLADESAHRAIKRPAAVDRRADRCCVRRRRRDSR
jgi:hypothetical protein